jgi:hypothetical protein
MVANQKRYLLSQKKVNKYIHLIRIFSLKHNYNNAIIIKK